MKVKGSYQTEWIPRTVEIVFESKDELTAFLEIMARDEVVPKHLVDTGHISNALKATMGAIMLKLYDTIIPLKYEAKK